MATLMIMIFIIPQSFMQLKLPFLGIVLLWVLVEGARNRWKIRSKAFLLYYLVFCFLTVIWCIIGLLRGHSETAILETLRVYVVFMILYCSLSMYVSNMDYQNYIDRIVIGGAIGIGAVALYTLLDQLFNLGWLPQSIKDDMYLQIGIHEGYTQMNNVNIGMLTFIVPYLVSRLLLIEREDRNKYLLLGLVFAVIAAVLASRRVVLILLPIAPLLAFGIAVMANQVTLNQLKRLAQLYLILLFTVGGAAMLIYYSDSNFLEGFTDRVLNVFTADPDAPRTLQHAALIGGFSDNYFWGSGFGGLTSVIRSDERPWTFELTYSRLLFNAGLLGVSLLILFFSAYLFLTLRKIRRSNHAAIHVALLTGFLSVLIASASNNYLSSFDFLFALSIIPLILNTQDRSFHRLVTKEALS
jgi:hypothetical protein